MKKLLIFTSAILLLAVLVPIIPTAEDRQIYEKTVRLHVLANSDSDTDQALKLRVRDSILTYLGPLLENVTDKEQAQTVINDNIDGILQTAQNQINDEGFSYPVSLSFTKEYYPRKEYDTVTLPAGTYLSLQVKIGESEGKNWWCVLFPTLCTSSAKPEEELTQAGFTTNQIRLITDSDSTRYKLKFKILEIFESFGK